MRDFLLYYIPLVSIGIGGLGFALMVASFVMIVVRGGWQKALQNDSQGRWSLPRKLLVAGASLGVLMAVLMMIFQALGGFRG